MGFSAMGNKKAPQGCGFPSLPDRDVRLTPKPPDMRTEKGSPAEKRKRQAEWLTQHGIEHDGSDTGVLRAFAQARQNYSRQERVACGDDSRSDAERQRRDAERDLYKDSPEVRPSSKQRMDRRAGSEMQTLKQQLYNRDHATRTRPYHPSHIRRSSDAEQRRIEAAVRAREQAEAEQRAVETARTEAAKAARLAAKRPSADQLQRLRACYIAGARVECARWHADPHQRTAYALGTIKAVLYDGNGAPGMLDVEVDPGSVDAHGDRSERVRHISSGLVRVLGERGCRLWRDRGGRWCEFT